ncbi:hypothetical protein B0A53_03346 [Rhodotorula sp. CCFEE 5036]|nr:hypothetical protein B0A53_03346 [Rhodotorula sp. CCFEE 5036]
MGSMAAAPAPRLIDIGCNLSDPVFRGSYHGKQAHQDDLEEILRRARDAGVHTQLLTGDCLEGSKEVLALAEQYEGLYTTIGCHPCRATEMDAYPGGPEAYIAALDEVIVQNKGKRAVAVGECGLDYDRLFLAPKEAQLRNFPPQLELASKHDLPLFLHSRNCHEDFAALLKAHGKPLRGVVHSHSGTAEEALELISLGFYIGVNGCSLKTQENVDAIKRLPLDKVMVESDAPWCQIRPSHASYPILTEFLQRPEYQHLKASCPSTLLSEERFMPVEVKKEKFVPGKAVKGRNEPYATSQVACVLASLHGVSLEEVADQTRRNTLALFGSAGMKDEPGRTGE